MDDLIPETITVDAVTWDWLQERLNDPPRPCPKLKALLNEPSVLEHVNVHHENGSMWADIDGCPGLFAAGDTPAELAESLDEAWDLWNEQETG